MGNVIRDTFLFPFLEYPNFELIFRTAYILNLSRHFNECNQYAKTSTRIQLKTINRETFQEQAHRSRNLSNI